MKILDFPHSNNDGRKMSTAEPEWFRCGRNSKVLLRISSDCVANNAIFRCILNKTRIYRTGQIVKLQGY